MKLRCPKCRLSDQLRISGIPLQPQVAVCNGCGCRFTVEYLIDEAESTISTEDKLLYCARCDRRQAFSKHCSSCGHEFVGYLRVSLSETGMKPLDDRGSQTGSTYAIRAVSAMTGVLERIRKSPLLAACLILAVAIIAAAVFAHTRSTAEHKFLSSYVKTLYGINAGVELCGRICCGSPAPNAADMVAVATSAPETGPAEGREELQTVREEIDSFMSKLDNPPKEYHTATMKLRALYDLYGRANTLALESISPSSQSKSRYEELRNEYRAAIANIKKDLHPKLANELKTAGTKYNMKFMQQ